MRSKGLGAATTAPRGTVRRTRTVSINPLAALGQNPFSSAFKCLARHGLVHTARAVVSTIVDVGFDLRYGTDTLRRVDMDALNVESEHKAHATFYQAAPAGPLRQILRKLKLPKDGVFVDLGSGKGRVLLIAAQFGFKKVVGVEFSRELCTIARDNVTVFTQRTNITARIDVVESDVANYPIATDHNVFFVNNPFDEVVMKRLLENLRRSVTQFPRKIWFIYLNPIHGDVIGRSGLFCACREFKTGGGRFWVYKA